MTPMPITHVMLIINGITWPNKSCSISFLLSKCKECSGAIDDTPGIMWHWHQHKWHHMMKKLCCKLFQLSWPNECNGTSDNALTLHDTDARAKVSKDWKSPVASLYHVEVRNTMVVLMMPSVWYDTNTGITWLTESCHNLFQMSSPNEQNGAIDDLVRITWQQFWYQ